MSTITCPECGVTYGIGGSPWCRDAHRTGASQAVPDDIPGGVWIHNMGHEPLFFTSQSAIDAAAKERGLIRMVRHVEGSPHTTDWSGPSPHTLATLGDWLAARSGTGAREERTKVDGPATGGWIGVHESPREFGVGVELPRLRVTQER